MNKGLKWGLIALFIYIIITSIGIFLGESARSILTDADAIEIPAQIMAGTFILINTFLKTGLIHGVSEGSRIFNIGNLITFIIGALIWFGAGFLLGWLLRKKKSKKENLRLLGKILMISALGIFIILALILSLMFLASGETDPLGTVLIFFISLGIFAPPFFIGLILWVISKFLKEKSIIN